MDNANSPSNAIVNAAIWEVVGDIQGFSQFNDTTSNAAYRSIRQGYENYRQAFNSLAPMAAAKTEPTERRAAVADLEQTLELAVGTIETQIRVIKQRASATARRGVPDLENAAAMMRQFGKAVCRMIRAGANPFAVH